MNMNHPKDQDTYIGTEVDLNGFYLHPDLGRLYPAKSRVPRHLIIMLAVGWLLAFLFFFAAVKSQQMLRAQVDEIEQSTITIAESNKVEESAAQTIGELNARLRNQANECAAAKVTSLLAR